MLTDRHVVDYTGQVIGVGVPDLSAVHTDMALHSISISNANTASRIVA